MSLEATHKRIDLVGEVGASRRYTMHSHTQFCDGRASMDDFARAAVAAGFTHYGFTPHSPIPVESPCNMSTDSVEQYLAEVERIRGAYGNRCRFYAGMEIDYLGPQWGPVSYYFRSLPLDYAIGSVHFIPAQGGEVVDIDGRFDAFDAKMRDHFHGDIEYVVNTFFDHSEAMIAAGGFEIIGHYDKIGHNASHYAPGIEQSAGYRERLERLTSMIIEAGLIVEINTKAWAEFGRMFPSAALLPQLVEAGVPILVNSDAHYTERIDASRAVAYEMLDRLNYKLPQR